MKRYTLFGLMIVVLLALDRAASAHFEYVQVVHHADVMTAAGPKTVYRLYAKFTDGADRLTGWGGSTNDPLTLYTGGCEPGVGYYQAPGGSNRAPFAKDIAFNPDLEWDSFFTIGVSVNDQGVPFDQTQFSHPFPNFTSVVPYSNSGVLFITPNTPQNRADFAGDGDPALRVLMMQLTVSPEPVPDGFFGWIRWRTSAGQDQELSFRQYFQVIEPFRRCCVPEGHCVITTNSGCSIFWNGLFDPTCGPCDACELTCVPDIVPHPGDGMVDVSDLLAVISAWGPQSLFKVPADVSPPHGNFNVNAEDLLVVIAGWGACPQRK